MPCEKSYKDALLLRSPQTNTNHGILDRRGLDPSEQVSPDRRELHSDPNDGGHHQSTHVFQRVINEGVRLYPVVESHLEGDMDHNIRGGQRNQRNLMRFEPQSLP